VVRYWCGYLLERFAYGPADATATPSSLGIISWQKIHIDYRSNSYRDIAISCDPETEREGKWEQGGRGGGSENERLGGRLTGDAATPWVV